MSRRSSESRAPLLAIAALTLLLLPALACGSAPQIAQNQAVFEAGSERAYRAEAMVDTVDKPLPTEPEAIAQPGPTPDAIFFEHYGVNPFIDTEDDNLSTFALDVDTGSYTVARGYVEDGFLHPKRQCVSKSS